MTFGKSFLSLFVVYFLFQTSYVCSQHSSEAIYFCTRDLDNGFSTAGVEEENIGNAYIKVIPNIGNSENTILRHCFMMHGVKVKSKSSHDYLSSRTTLGFFYDSEINEAIYANEELSNQVVSCTPVRVINKGEKGTFIWNDIANFYNSEILKGYNTFSHNCCTVAYNSISAVGGDNSAIDPRSFNFGVGIRWKFEDSGSSYGLLKSVGIVSDQMLYMAESASPSSQRSEDDKEKDEL